MSDNVLRIGLPKGSLQNSTVELFRKAGFPVTVDERAYSPDLGDDELWGVLLRAQELPMYIVNGVLEGNIDAQGQIELGHESRMNGNIRAAKIAIADGCYFQGKIKMFHEGSQPFRFKEKRTSSPSGSSTPKKDSPV